MRTIKFRGQRIDNKEWVYGLFFKTSRGSFVGEYLEEQEVIPETVGQFTGLTDKDGEEIYEGDILKSVHTSTLAFMENPVVTWDEKGFYSIDSKNSYWEYINYYETDTELEIIGNIHTNPELLNK